MGTKGLTNNDPEQSLSGKRDLNRERDATGNSVRKRRVRDAKMLIAKRLHARTIREYSALIVSHLYPPPRLSLNVVATSQQAEVGNRESRITSQIQE